MALCHKAKEILLWSHLSTGHCSGTPVVCSEVILQISVVFTNSLFRQRRLSPDNLPKRIFVQSSSITLSWTSAFHMLSGACRVPNVALGFLCLFLRIAHSDLGLNLLGCSPLVNNLNVECCIHCFITLSRQVYSNDCFSKTSAYAFSSWHCGNTYQNPRDQDTVRRHLVLPRRRFSFWVRWMWMCPKLLRWAWVMTR